MSSVPSTRPVVALDVDGVLNPSGLDAELDGYVRHDVHVPAHDVPDSPFIRGGGTEPLDVRLFLHPAHGPWITSLREVADVVWATTWESAANRYIAPLLGIDPLPVGVSVAQNPPRFGYVRNGETGAWKAEALCENFGGRPLVWADDMAGTYVHDRDYDNLVETTRHLVNSRSERTLANARAYRWEDHSYYAPEAHYEDTWASGGFVVRSTWSHIGHDVDFRFHGGAPDPAPTMVVQPAPEVGLTPSQMDRISAFVHAHAAS